MQNKHFKQILRVFIGLISFMLLHTSAYAAPNAVRLKDFGDRGLSIYLAYSHDTQMLRALVAVDLAEGRRINSPDTAALAHVASSMAASPNKSWQDYVNYYTASSTHKQNIHEHSARLSAVVSSLSNKAFPLPANTPTWYIDNWHAYRGDNGERFHEGTDITCPMGTPVRSMGDGIVEKIGWNTLGGWRIGIRDNNDGMYYYYAHLSGYASGMYVGAKVSMGQVIGYSGDSGNGPQGTTGLYEPHLHIGIYEGSPLSAINPYPIILNAERNRW